MATIGEAESQWLKDHRLCVLATGRKDGSPQQSFVTYQFDGSQFLMGCSASSFKAKNLNRNPRASLTIVDGRGHVVVYGSVDLINDAAEMEKVQERFGPRPARQQPAAGAETPRPASPPPGGRCMILFTPNKIISNRMNG